MTVRLYKSTDASAPVLTGQVGTLVALLLACLVNGYGSKTAAGWTQGQNTTNKSQFVMAAGGTGFSIWVDDSAVTTAKEARVAGYATMSATTPTGTGQFPTSAQSTIGTGMLVIRKSTTADATARAWTLIADGHTFYLFTETGDYTGPLAAFSFGFGDFFAMGSGDTSNCMIIGRQVENTNAPNTNSGNVLYESFPQLCYPITTTLLSTTLNGHYVASMYTNVGGSIAVGKHTDQTKMGIGTGGNGMQVGFLGMWQYGGGDTTWTNSFIFPNPPDSGLYLAPIFIHHGGMLRGYLKGLWAPLQHLPLTHNDVVVGNGNMAGKSLIAQSCVGITAFITGGFAAQFLCEYSDTWT